MKNGWQSVRFGDVCELVKGRKPSLRDRKEKGDKPYLLAKVLRGEPPSQYATPSDRNAVAVEAEETIIICDGSNSGETFFGFSGILSSTMAKLRITRRDVNPAYLRLFLLMVADDLRAGKVGAAIPHLDRDALYEMTISLPPLPEQHRIVAILDKTVEIIAVAKANTERSLKNSKDVFCAQLRELFCDKGAAWRQMRLPDIAKIFARGKSRHRPRNEPSLYNGQYPFIQTGDISDANHWLKGYTQTYSDRGLAQSRMWPKGTVCIAIVGATVGESAILGFDACFPDSVIGVVVDDRVADNEYVEFLLQAFKAMLKEKGKGTARDNINLRCFEDQTFPVPSLEEQKRIVVKLNALDHGIGQQVACWDRKLAALDELKASLLHQAFTGQL